MTTLINFFIRFFYPLQDAIIHSVEEKFYDSELSKSIAICGMTQAETINVPKKASFAAWFRVQYAFIPRHTFIVRGAQLNDDGGCRIGRWILQESYGNYADMMRAVAYHRMKKFLLPWRYASVTFDCPIIFIHATGYYHFVTEWLPCLLHALKVTPDATVLVTEKGVKRYPFIREFLNSLAEKSIIKDWQTTAASTFACREYTFHALPENCGFVRPSYMNLLRDTFLDNKVIPGSGRKVFISRSKASRSFENQQDVEGFLQNIGFEIVHLEELSVREQIALFSVACVVVANHGAGLTNLIFGKEKTKVLELFSPNFLNDCYCRLAGTMGMVYDYVVAEPYGSWGLLDITEFEKKMRQMEIV